MDWHRPLNKREAVAWAIGFATGAILGSTVLATAAWGQELTTCDAVARIPGASEIRLGGDRIILAPHDTARAQLCYENHAAKASKQGGWAASLGDFTVSGRLEVSGRETLTVKPPEGYMVFPADAAMSQVEDGRAVVMLIFSGVS